MGNKLQLFGMSFFTFIIPMISLFVPLAIAPVFIIIAIYPTFLFIKECNIKNIWKDSDVNKAIIILLAYSLISSIWAIRPNESINLWVRMLLIFIGTLGLFAYAPKITDKEKILKSLLCGVILALVFINIEIFTNGFISRLLGVDYKVSHKFELVIFNRGSSVLSLMSWAVICYLSIQKKYKSALAFFIAVLATIARLDSTSAVLGFFVGGVIIFPIVYYKGQKSLRIFAILAIAGVFTVAALAAKMDAHKLVGNVPVIPGAASDIRLYIWDYSAKQALKKPIFGWGFNSSRSYPVQEKDYVQGGRSPLPLHPHNNTLQVWLELGAVGLFLFAAFLSLILIRISKTVTNPSMMAVCTALFANYFIIGQTGYGIWQNWLVGSGIIAATLLIIAMNYRPSDK